MRTIKFSIWDPNQELMHYNIGLDKIHLYIFDGDNITEQEGLVIREWTGLTDRNCCNEIYECDIIDVNGIKVGNIYETPNLLEDSTNYTIAGMGTKAWRSTEQKAIERGCIFAE